MIGLLFHTPTRRDLEISSDRFVRYAEEESDKGAQDGTYKWGFGDSAPDRYVSLYITNSRAIAGCMSKRFSSFVPKRFALVHHSKRTLIPTACVAQL